MNAIIITPTDNGRGEVSCAYLNDIKYVPALATLTFHSTYVVSLPEIAVTLCCPVHFVLFFTF